ncbi:MAG: 23S rRNA (uracil(1939)-C(5))-methyltransferase RlmD [Alphaproteobacteria bacterium]|nr:23S rRNA (uracil(1939)-C(5))-methyltransferase RlmD [Alphaproteobacteria bacterium]
MPDTVEITIGRLGTRGDGVAYAADGDLFVAGALPGERVAVTPGPPRGDGRTARLEAVLDRSPDRVPAPCPHFGNCGGCTVQHLASDAYSAWKRALVVGALQRHGLDGALVAPLQRPAPALRRRAEFAATRGRGKGDGVTLGFHASASDRVVDLRECLVLDQALIALLPPLRQALAGVVRPGDTADVMLTRADNGIDVLIGGTRPLRSDAVSALARLAETQDLARIAWRGKGGGSEPVAQRRLPRLALGGVPVALPPGAFVQAVAAAERALTSIVLDALAGLPARATVADLFAGCGPFTLALASAGRRVHAVDGAADAIAALLAAAGAAGFSGRATAETRDLARRPLMAAELDRHGAVVFDPPRGGAAAQAAEIARSKVKLVVAISCNPATFARDASILAAGGYALRAVQPVDQFVHTGHVELVAVFVRQ